MNHPSHQTFASASIPENYERFFVPVIGGPAAEDLLAAAKLRPGERVLDAACGTGIVARAAARAVGPTGAVAGLDINPGMLATARRHTPSAHSIEWYEASVESMPLPDGNYDVVLCQMGLQFVRNKQAALGEMRRVLASGGRALVAVPGPTPDLFAIMIEALARRIGPEAAAFASMVFSLHDAEELRLMFGEAGFRNVDVRSATVWLDVPAPQEFLWQYIASTPMAQPVMKADADCRDALEREITERWQRFRANGGMRFEARMVTAIGRT